MPLYWGTQKIGEVYTENHQRTWIEIDNIYPIGSVYISVTSSNPSELFGGTWERIQDTFLLAAGNTYTAGSTGGVANVTLTTSQIPSHTHSIGAHTHGLNSHTHTYDKANSPTGGPSTNTSGSTTLTVNQIPSHSHQENNNTYGYIGENAGYWQSNWRDNHTGTQGYYANQHTSTYATGGGQGHTHTLSSHTHTNSYTSTNSGAASGDTTDNVAFNSGFSGSGEAHSNMPPYLAVYIWKRIA